MYFKLKTKMLKVKITTQSSKVFSFLLLLCALTFTLYAFSSPVLAADDIGISKITPASPLYFLKSIREILELKFAPTTNVKALRRLEFATRRVREAKSLVGTPREGLIEPTMARYLSELDELRSVANIKDGAVAADISRATAAQMDVLQGIHKEVVDPKAKRSIRAAVNGLTRWQQQLIDKLNAADQTTEAQQVTLSKLSGCNFLSKEASNSALNDIERAVFAERAQKCLMLKP